MVNDFIVQFKNMPIFGASSFIFTTAKMKDDHLEMEYFIVVVSQGSKVHIKGKSITFYSSLLESLNLEEEPVEYGIKSMSVQAANELFLMLSDFFLPKKIEDYNEIQRRFATNGPEGLELICMDKIMQALFLPDSKEVRDFLNKSQNVAFKEHIEFVYSTLKPVIEPKDIV
jgi:hypothetical protein